MARTAFRRRAVFWVLVPAGFCLLFCHCVPSAVYHPEEALESTPADWGLSYEEMFFSTPDGEKLHAWWIPAPNPLAVLLFCHGNAGNISHRRDLVLLYHHLGCSVFLFDYRGFGRSSGRPSEKGTYTDARAAWDLLLSRGAPPRRTIILGRSLGGAVAARLASEVNPGGLILDSAFYTLEDVARHHLGWVRGWMLLGYSYDTAASLEKTRCPVLILHSPADEVVPFSHAPRLLAKTEGRGRLVRTSGGHNGGSCLTPAYRLGVKDFLGRVVSSGAEDKRRDYRSRTSRPVVIPVDGPLSRARAEVSSMEWCGNTLVLVPQYPGRLGNRLFGLDRADVLAALETTPPGTVHPFPIALDDGKAREAVPGFEGYEAVCFDQDRTWLAVEARDSGFMRSYVLSGRLDLAARRMEVYPPSVEIPLPAQVPNFSCEAAVCTGGVAVLFYEANGRGVNPDPTAWVLSSGTQTTPPEVVRTLSMSPLEYRLTDATAPGGDGVFWAVNYLYPEHRKKLSPEADPWPHPPGLSREVVERLVQLEVHGPRVEPADLPAVYLADADPSGPRNWEAAALLGDRGVLLFTDSHPGSLFAFVPFPLAKGS
ncbi:MAG: alpha/beta hydrolase, partial [Deltaproteobacteria bacterium]|nr:alpha/beta hydrolase [Deltaproteobacteria bacterium]